MSDSLPSGFTAEDYYYWRSHELGRCWMASQPFVLLLQAKLPPMISVQDKNPVTRFCVTQNLVTGFLSCTKTHDISMDTMCIFLHKYLFVPLRNLS